MGQGGEVRGHQGGLIRNAGRRAVRRGISGAIEYIRGTLRALAVTIATRSPVLPNIPAVAEFVPGYEAFFVYGLGTPRNLLHRTAGPYIGVKSRLRAQRWHVCFRQLRT